MTQEAFSVRGCELDCFVSRWWTFGFYKNGFLFSREPTNFSRNISWTEIVSWLAVPSYGICRAILPRPLYAFVAWCFFWGATLYLYVCFIKQIWGTSGPQAASLTHVVSLSEFTHNVPCTRIYRVVSKLWPAWLQIWWEINTNLARRIRWRAVMVNWFSASNRGPSRPLIRTSPLSVLFRLFCCLHRYELQRVPTKNCFWDPYTGCTRS